MNTKRILLWGGVIVIVLLLLALGVWYRFLRQETTSVQEVGTARGLGETSPTFTSPGGSTLSHIVAGLGVSERTGGASTTANGSRASAQNNAAGAQNDNPSSAADSGFSSAADTAAGKKLPRFWHVQTSPVGGPSLFMSSTTLRYSDRATGNIFEANLRSGTLRRVTNTLIPKMYSAFFMRDGSLLGRMLDQKNEKTITFLGIPVSSTSSAPVSIKTTPLGEDIFDIVTSKTGKEILVLTPDGNGGSIITRSNPTGSNPKRIFASGVSDWRMQWLPDGRIVISQNPATGIAGYAYEIAKDGSLLPIARAIQGLTILPRSTSTAILIGSDSGVLSLTVRPSSDASSIALPIRTITDKCVWAPGKSLIAYCAVPQKISSSNFLDEWYRGALHTSDAWWKIDAGSGTATILASQTEAGETLDVENPVIDDTGSYISFDNFADKSLWIFRISEK